MTKVNNIKVFGSGCPTCKKLYEVVVVAVAELGIETDVEYINDIQKMLDLGIMSSPALVVDNKILLSGQLVDKERVKKLLVDNGLATVGEEKNAGCCGGGNSGGCCCGGGKC